MAGTSFTDIHAKFDVDYGEFGLHVDLHIPGRGVTALFGHSGSGKTTLLRCVAGLEQKGQGYLRFLDSVWRDDNHGVHLPVWQRPLGYVFQDASLFPHMTVRQNMEYGQKRVPAAKRLVAVEQAVDLLGIGPIMDRHPDRLSGGERQRVGIARALATSPRILLMDEPLSALDLKRKREILPYLERLHDELQIPVLYVTHSPEEVARLADHLVIMEGGLAIAAGAVDVLLTRPDLPLAHGREAESLVHATIAAHEPEYHLTKVHFAGGALYVPLCSHPIGAAMRVVIQAKEVSLSRAPAPDSSLLNVLPVEVLTVNDDGPGQVILELNAKGTRILSRITAKSAHKLRLTVGDAMFAQIKGVSLLD